MTLAPITFSQWMAVGVTSLVMAAAVVGVLRVSRRIASAGARWSVALISFAFCGLISSWTVGRVAAAFLVAGGSIKVPPRADFFVHVNPIAGLVPALIAGSVGIWSLRRGREGDRVA